MRSSRFAKSGLGIPYALFLLLFVVAPLFVLLYYAFTNGQGQFTAQNLADYYGLSQVKYQYIDDPRLHKIVIFWQYS